MAESIQSIISWYQAYYADGFYLVMALFSYIYLFAHCPELRKKFLAPMALVMFLALNPVLYKYIYSQIIYWRLFWMFPTAILTSLAAVKMVKSSQGKIGKGVVLAAICVLIVVNGANVYTERGFGKIANAYKVPKEVQEICDIMLELEENPRCIVPQTLFSDVRQYAGEIEMAYGRDVQGYIITAPWETLSVWRQVESINPDYSVILQYASQENYQIIVAYEDRPIAEELLALYGYVQIAYDGGYFIYHKA